MMAEYRRVEGLHSSSRRRCLIVSNDLSDKMQERNPKSVKAPRNHVTQSFISSLTLLHHPQDLFRIVPYADEHGGDEDSCVFYTR